MATVASRQSAEVIDLSERREKKIIERWNSAHKQISSAVEISGVQCQAVFLASWQLQVIGVFICLKAFEDFLSLQQKQLPLRF
ncbi:MAG: hypothetical protein HY432_01995 [Candidatus Liptonbacteria bacterium]|nr:hypothetical protein [Candidatus Liptonbacteria bacterium]